MNWSMTTGWRWCIGCLKLHLSFRRKATNYRALLHKVSYKYKSSYAPSPPCTCIVLYFAAYLLVEKQGYMFVCAVEWKSKAKEHEKTQLMTNILRKPDSVYQRSTASTATHCCILQHCNTLTMRIMRARGESQCVVCVCLCVCRSVRTCRSLLEVSVDMYTYVYNCWYVYICL